MPAALTNQGDSTPQSTAAGMSSVPTAASPVATTPPIDALPQVQPAPLPFALKWSVLFVIYTAIAVLLTGYRYLDDLSRNRSGTFAIRSLEEVTGVYTAFVLVPFVFW